MGIRYKENWLLTLYEGLVSCDYRVAPSKEKTVSAYVYLLK